MKHNLLKLINCIKNALKLNKNSFNIKISLKTIPFLRFLKSKNLIINYIQKSEDLWTIYLPVYSSQPLIKDIQIMLTHNTSNFNKSNQIFIEKLKIFHICIFITEHGFMDQFDLKKSKLGGILLCKFLLS